MGVYVCVCLCVYAHTHAYARSHVQAHVRACAFVYSLMTGEEEYAHVRAYVHRKTTRRLILMYVLHAGSL